MARAFRLTSNKKETARRPRAAKDAQPSGKLVTVLGISAAFIMISCLIFGQLFQNEQKRQSSSVITQAALVAESARTNIHNGSAVILPLPEGFERYDLIGDGQNSSAGPRSLKGAEFKSPGFSNSQFLQNGERVVSACRQIAAEPYLVCVTRPAPLFTNSMVLSVILLGIMTALGTFMATRLQSGALRKPGNLQKADHNDRYERLYHRFSSLIETSEAGFFELTTKPLQIKFSGRIARMLNVSESPLNGQAFLGLMPQDNHNQIRHAINRGVESGYVNLSFTSNSIPDRDIIMKGARSPDDPTKIIGLAIPNASNGGGAAQGQLLSAVSGFSGPMALWDKARRLIFWNRAFEMAFETQPHLVRLGAAYEELTKFLSSVALDENHIDEEGGTREIALQDGRWFKIFEEQIASGDLFTFGIDITHSKELESTYRSRDRDMNRLISDLERSEGEAAEMAKKYQEEKIRAEDASKSKSVFLANMSHELRTPLNAINGFSECIQNEIHGQINQQYVEYASDIREAGQHLLDMINDILDMAKIEAGKMTIHPRPIDPTDPVDAAIRMVRRKAEDKKIKLIPHLSDDCPEIEADHRAIKQMILNLLSNAIKFTEEGGEIIVYAREEKDQFVMRVIDNGVGIASEHLHRLGNAFEQAENERDRAFGGTGLGLALTKSFAEMHGGRLEIDSELGVGTQIAIFLPLGDQLQTHSEQNVSANAFTP